MAPGQHEVENACPWCGYGHDMVTEIGSSGEPPEAGDCTICTRCSGIGIFETTTTVRKATEEERRAILADQEGIDAMLVTVMFRERMT